MLHLLHSGEKWECTSNIVAFDLILLFMVVAQAGAAMQASTYLFKEES